MASLVEAARSRVESHSLLKELLLPRLRVPTQIEVTTQDSETEAGGEGVPLEAVRQPAALNSGVAGGKGTATTADSVAWDTKFVDLSLNAHSPSCPASGKPTLLSCDREGELSGFSSPSQSNQRRTIEPIDEFSPSQAAETRTAKRLSLSRSNAFASGTRYISTFVSSVFSPTSVGSSRAVIEEDFVDEPADSPRIYSLDKGIYIGSLIEMPPPPKRETEWQNSIRIRLVKDLQPVTQNLPRNLKTKETIIEPELCMVGEVDSKTQYVTMKPTVWIRCGSKKCRKAVQKAVDDLHYLQIFSRGRVQVHLHAPWPAGDSGLDALGEQYGHDSLQLQLQHYPMSSACGAKLLISVKSGDAKQLWTSTIGGLIRVDNHVYALTTAHSIFQALESGAQGDHDTQSNSDSDTESLFSLDDNDYNFTGSKRLTAQDGHSVQSVASETLQAVDVALELASYAGHIKRPLGQDGFTTTHANGDFALIRWPTGAAPPKNEYRSFTGPTIEVDSMGEDLCPGEVVILLGSEDVITGSLLPGIAVFLQRDAIFHTRKIQTSSPLMPGCSGSWVIRGRHLIGQIVAAYHGEPYVHMLPIQEIVSAIKGAVTSHRPSQISSTVEVSLQTPLRSPVRQIVPKTRDSVFSQLTPITLPASLGDPENLERSVELLAHAHEEVPFIGVIQPEPSRGGRASAAFPRHSTLFSYPSSLKPNAPYPGPDMRDSLSISNARRSAKVFKRRYRAGRRVWTSLKNVLVGILTVIIFPIAVVRLLLCPPASHDSRWLRKKLCAIRLIVGLLASFLVFILTTISLVLVTQEKMSRPTRVFLVVSHSITLLFSALVTVWILMLHYSRSSRDHTLRQSYNSYKHARTPGYDVPMELDDLGRGPYESELLVASNEFLGGTSM